MPHGKGVSNGFGEPAPIITSAQTARLTRSSSGRRCDGVHALGTQQNQRRDGEGSLPEHLRGRPVAQGRCHSRCQICDGTGQLLQGPFVACGALVGESLARVVATRVGLARSSAKTQRRKATAPPNTAR